MRQPLFYSLMSYEQYKFLCINFVTTNFCKNQIALIMKQNIGRIDKIIRYLIAIVICILYLTNVVTGVFSIVLLVIAAILILTSLFSFCGIYAIFGVNTLGTKK